MRSAEIALGNADRDLMPVLDLVGSYGGSGVNEFAMAAAWEDTINLDFPAWTLGLQFVVPIGNNAARGNRDRAALQLERVKRDLYAAEVDVAQEVRDALRQLTTLAESIRAARESVRLAENVLDTERPTPCARPARVTSVIQRRRGRR